MATRAKSPLITIVNISPNKTVPRNKSVGRLTPHCVAGNATVETIGAIFAPTSRQASCTVGIGSDGRYISIVNESDRSWCTSSATNDHIAITFEISNDGLGPNWHMSDKAINSWLNIAVEQCKFYGYSKVNYQAKPANINPKFDSTTAVENWIATWAKAGEMIITLHCWYANKACPGPYFIGLIPTLVAEINNRLAGKAPVLFNSGTTVPGSVSRPTLSQGSTGDYVKELQTKLNSHGANPVLTVDGSFGPGTNTAVKDFQRSKGLTVDGVVGTATWTELDKSPSTVTTPPTPTPQPVVPPDYSAYRKVIQDVCGFSDPQGVWDVIEKHAFTESLYSKLSSVLATKPSRDECKAIIQARCNFSSPEGVWAVLDQHRFSDDLYHRLAMMMATK